MRSDPIHVFEVGPRDGLQNESGYLPLKCKTQFISSLVQAGVENLEVGAFVRPDRVPQMADTDRICTQIKKGSLQLKTSNAWFLVPNRRGLERALRVGVTHIAIFTAATESFAKKNIGMTIQDSLLEYKEVIREGRKALGSRFKVRGYVSTAFGCPFEGKVSSAKALRVIEKLSSLGVDQLSIGDTIGVANPASVKAIIQPALKFGGSKRIAVHFHDTRGTALANALRSMDLGVRIIDSSAGGLGGCPFAPGAAGNLATEDLVYMLNGMGIRSGINLDSLCRASLAIYKKLNKPITSRYLQAWCAES